jgi:hypothetical protein
VKRSSTEKMMAKVEEELKRKGFDNLWKEWVRYACQEQFQPF